MQEAAPEVTIFNKWKNWEYPERVNKTALQSSGTLHLHPGTLVSCHQSSANALMWLNNARALISPRHNTTRMYRQRCTSTPTRIEIRGRIRMWDHPQIDVFALSLQMPADGREEAKVFVVIQRDPHGHEPSFQPGPLVFRIEAFVPVGAYAGDFIPLLGHRRWRDCKITHTSSRSQCCDSLLEKDLHRVA